MSISCATPGHFICVKNNLTRHGWLEEWEPFESSLDTMFDKDKAARRRKARKERAEAEEKQKAREKKRKERETEAALQKEDEARLEREREAALAEELAMQYYLWKTSWEDSMVKNRALTTFPHFPVQVLFCEDVSCKSFKEEEGSLRACRHDVERLFRASGLYNHGWLKKERLGWHPDRFGLRCDPDFRKALRRKAEQLYQIHEELIAQGGGDDGAWEDIP